jgi:hypothetical protein
MNVCVPCPSRIEASSVRPHDAATHRVRAPALILLGAQKAGSSFLFDALAQHPCCHASTPKEPSYFSRWDRVRSDEHWHHYAQLFDAGDDAKSWVTLEATTAYLADEQAPRRMRERLPCTTRFIAILRNPSERSVSAYWHLYKRGDERRDIQDALGFVGTDLQDSIGLEQTRCEQAVARGDIQLTRYRDRYDDPVWQARYLANSTYMPALQRFADVFGRDQLHVLFFERLLAEPREVWRELCEFLELDPAVSCPDVTRPANPTRVPRRTAASRLVRSLHCGSLERFTRHHATGLHAALARLKYAPKPPTPLTLTRKLSALFESHNRDLADWLGVDLPPNWRDRSEV